MYVVRRADDGLTVSSIRVALAAIRTAHQLAGVGLDLTQPRFRMTLEGVVRSRGVRPTRQGGTGGARRTGRNAGRPPLPRVAAWRQEPRHAAARLWRRPAPLRTGRP